MHEELNQSLSVSLIYNGRLLIRALLEEWFVLNALFIMVKNNVLCFISLSVFL